MPDKPPVDNPGDSAEYLSTVPTEEDNEQMVADIDDLFDGMPETPAGPLSEAEETAAAEAKETADAEAAVKAAEAKKPVEEKPTEEPAVEVEPAVEAEPAVEPAAEVEPEKPKTAAELKAETEAELAAKPPERTPEEVLAQQLKDAELESAKEENTLLREALKTIQEGKKPDAPAGEVAEELERAFDFKLPDPLKAAINSGEGDQMIAALETVATGVAEAVRKQIIQTDLPAAVSKLIETSHSERDAVSETQQTAARAVSDFYATHPGYNTEQLRPHIALITNELVKELKVEEWSPALGEAIALRAAARLGFDGKAAAAKPTVKAGRKAAGNGKPPRQVNTGARPAGLIAPGTPSSQEEEIADLYE